MKKLLALIMVLVLSLTVAGCKEEEPVLDGVGQEVTFFALPIGGYQCMYSDEIVPVKLQLLAREGDYAKKGSVLRSAELIAPNGVRYPLILAGISPVKDGKKIYGYDSYTVDGQLELPAEGMHRFFAMEIRYGENEEQVEIIPLGGDLAFEVIPRSNLVEPLYSEGYGSVVVQEDPEHYPYRFNALENEARLQKIWIAQLTAIEAPDSEEGLPLAGSIALPGITISAGESLEGLVQVVCPKLEVVGSKGSLYQHGSPVYCGVTEAHKDNKEKLSALAEAALAIRVAFTG